MTSTLAYHETSPAGPSAPIVLSSPHSGRVLPPEVEGLLRVPTRALSVFEDGPTDSIAAAAALEGAQVLAAHYARAFVDLNRETSEIDPLLCQPSPLLERPRVNARVLAGLGVIPSRLSGQPIYKRPLEAQEVAQRLLLGYHPYHRRLAALLVEQCRRHGAALLIDLHSMPNEVALIRGQPTVDIAIGDRFGKACEPELADLAAWELGAAGLQVARNRPYAGGHITERYGRPAEGMSALQLEIRRDLFMDERSGRPTRGVEKLQLVLRRLVRRLAAAMDQSPAIAAQ